jgi:ubiquitin-conjugating enzyme E2 S
MLVVCELTIALVFGTDGTPYEGGVFRMKLILSHDFPQTPPKGALISFFLFSTV